MKLLPLSFSVKRVGLLPVGLGFAICGAGALSCGGSEARSQGNTASSLNTDVVSAALLQDDNGSAQPAATAGPYDVDQNMGLDIVQCDNVSNGVTPARLPEPGQDAPDYTVTFCVKMTLNGTDTQVSQFTHDKTKWGLAFGPIGQTKYRIGEPVVTVDDDGSFSESDDERQGRVTIKLIFDETRFPEDFGSSLYEDVNGRKRLRITPYYSDVRGSPTQNAEPVENDVLFLQNDRGAIKAPGSFKNVKATDGSAVISLAPPTSTASEDVENGSLAEVGSSSVGSYLVMYWKDDECRTSAAGWKFSTNEIYRRDKNDSALKTLTDCSYPGAVEGATTLGCDTSPEPKLFGNKSLNDVAIPVGPHPDAGSKVAKPSGACYHLVKTSNTTVQLSDLENGQTYGATFWVLDANGRLGSKPSPVKSFIPVNVPLASTKKNPELKKSAEDCFVVTAASGSVNSPAVVSWRAIRDRYLVGNFVGMSFVRWYYENGPHLAAWLHEHPALKPYLNEIFAVSGKTVLNIEKFAQETSDALEKAWETFSESFSAVMQNLWVSTAQAQETPETTEQPTAEQPTPAPTATPLETPAPVKSEESTSATVQSGQSSSSVDTSSIGDRRAYLAAPGVPSSQFYVLAGTMQATDEKKYFDTFYKKGRPFSLKVGQTYKLLDLSGELGFGAEGTYLGQSGSVPASEGQDVAGTKIGFYAFGANLVVDYRLRIGMHPWLAPRLSLFGGMERLREESDLAEPETAQSGNGDTANEDDAPRPKNGISRWNPRAGARLALEISAFRFFPQDYASARYGYGLEDITLDVYGAYEKSFAEKGLSTSGLFFGGGISLLFL